MVGWILLLVVLALVLLACVLRLGVAAGYEEGGGWVKVHLGPKWVSLYPVPQARTARRRKKQRHCFSYSVEMAREYLNMGMYLGIGGVLTYKNARVLKEVVDYAPMDRIVLETDSPYLTPVPNRGKRNSSLNLPYVVMAIAEIKGITTAEVEDITWENAMKLYRMAE